MDTEDWVVTIDTSMNVNARIGKIKTFRDGDIGFVGFFKYENGHNLRGTVGDKLGYFLSCKSDIIKYSDVEEYIKRKLGKDRYSKRQTNLFIDLKILSCLYYLPMEIISIKNDSRMYWLSCGFNIQDKKGLLFYDSACNLLPFDEEGNIYIEGEVFLTRKEVLDNKKGAE